jgi:hypothetical protein
MTSVPASLPSLSKLHDLLNLLAELRNLSNPFDSAAALKSTLELLTDLGSILGVNHELLNWLTDIETNTPLLDLVLSVGRFLESFLPLPLGEGRGEGAGSVRAPSPTNTITIQSLGLTQLLPLIIELIQLLHRLRAPSTGAARS